MALKRMDNVGIVVDDLGGTIDFFRELGLELEGRATFVTSLLEDSYADTTIIVAGSLGAVVETNWDAQLLILMSDSWGLLSNTDSEFRGA